MVPAGLIIPLAEAETTLQRVAHYAEIVTGVVSLLAIFSVLLLARQVRQEALDGRTSLITTIGQSFIEHPETRKYFYNGVEPRGEHAKAQAIAVSLAGAMDYAAAHFDHMPRHTRNAWQAYFDFIYDNSPVFRRHLAEHASWYGPRFREYFRLETATLLNRAWRRARCRRTHMSNASEVLKRLECERVDATP